MKTSHILVCSGFFACALPACLAQNSSPGGASEAQSLAQQAEVKLQQPPSKQNFEDAAGLLNRANKLDPENSEITLKLGWVYADRLHDPQSAYPYLADAAKRRPDDANARKLYGLVCSQTGRQHQALTEFREAVKLDPDDLWAKANLGRAYARLGNFSKADAIYAEVLQKDPNNAEARLGQAELTAWRGHSGKALEMLNQIIAQNPTNATALVLRGDVHRWDWDLNEARQDYQQALAVSENEYDATTGIEQADKMAASDITLRGYQFKDKQHFLREYAEAGARIHLADPAYLFVRGAAWRFTNPGFAHQDRADGAAGVEYHFGRVLEASLEGDAFAYQHHDVFPGARLYTKLSPLTGFDIYTTLGYDQPFISSMPAVTNALKERSIGNGLDIQLVGGFSVQNRLNLARISDHNTWWEDKPQLSYRLFGSPLTFIRAEYDYLSYSHSSTNYWTPSHWQAVSPVLDTSLPIGKHVRINVVGKAPYVFDASKFGFQVEGGPVIEVNNWLEFGGSYIYASIPGDPHIAVPRPPWAGQGWQAYLRIRF